MFDIRNRHQLTARMQAYHGVADIRHKQHHACCHDSVERALADHVVVLGTLWGSELLRP